MHLVSDYIHPYRSTGGRRAQCRVQIYLPEDVRDSPVVICSELPNNSGGSGTHSAVVIATEADIVLYEAAFGCQGGRRCAGDRSSRLDTNVHLGPSHSQ
jgi:hypothetical protein